MRKLKPTVSIILLVLFLISAVSGLVMFFMPHHPRPESVQTAGAVAQAVKDAARAEGRSVVFYIKNAHEYLSVIMAFTALLHIMLNWGSLKSYIIRR